MSKGIALLLVLFLLMPLCMSIVKPALSSAAVTEDTWVSKAPMQVARGGLGVAAVNGKIYAIGGSIISGLYPPNLLGGFVGKNEEYDPVTDTWSFKTPMPTPRADFATAVYQNKIYCIGGVVDIAKHDIWSSYVLSGVNEVYDPATDTWETKTPMPTARMYVEANVVGGKIYLTGGFDQMEAPNEVYDPATDTWTRKAPLPTGGSHHASAVVDNKIFVIASNIYTLDEKLKQRLLIYYTEIDSWSEGTSAPSFAIDGPADATTGVMAPKRIYVLGVEPGTGPPPVNHVYDPKSDCWTAGATIPTNRLDFDVAVVNDKVYAIGGYTFDNYPNNGKVTVSAVNEQYTPIGYGTPDPSYGPPDSTTPEISVMSPKNWTCYKTKLPLIFTVSESASWMRFKLDGTRIIDVEGNSTLTGLSAGLHNITIYATDAAGNTGTSKTVYFTVDDALPLVSVLAPENKTYNATEIPLNFTVNEDVSKMSYSLDGQENVAITGNVTLSGLPSGLHNIIVYAEDVAGNVGFSEAIPFSVAEPEMSPVTLVAVASVATLAIIGAGLLYLKKVKKKTPQEATTKEV